MKEKTKLKWLRLKLLIGVFLVTAGVQTQAYAQETIKEFGEVVNLPVSTNRTHSLNKLCMEMVPSILLKNNVLESTNPSQPALRIITDVSSINKLYDNNALYNSVEVVIIQIKDLNEFSNMQALSSLANMSNLDYIYFSCSFELCNNVSDEIECEKLKIGTKIIGDSFPVLIYSSELSE